MATWGHLKQAEIQHYELYEELSVLLIFSSPCELKWKCLRPPDMKICPSLQLGSCSQSHNVLVLALVLVGAFLPSNIAWAPRDIVIMLPFPFKSNLKIEKWLAGECDWKLAHDFLN